MMQDWFVDAKLGIFIHWGIYAVKGVGESWSFYHGSISYEDYMAQCEGFTAENYDPQGWAQLFKEAGAKYAVLTTKHHDGVALWDTKANDLSVVHKTPAGRDLITPYVDALREQDLKVGLYYSHSDWSHPDYPTIWRTDEREKKDEIKRNRFVHPSGDEDFEAWERFLKFHRTQMEELITEFGPIDLLWFDGDWERDVEQWKFKEFRAWLDYCLMYPGKSLIMWQLSSSWNWKVPLIFTGKKVKLLQIINKKVGGGNPKDVTSLFCPCFYW